MSRRCKRNTRDKGAGWEEMGGYMNAKIQKLQNQFEAESTNASKCMGKKLSDIFKGVSIFVNGYTKPPSDVLKKLMHQHGGMYHHYYGRNKVSHIIASNLPNSKIKALTDQKVVKPEWITESIDAEKLLPYENYLLYTAKSAVQPGLKAQLLSKPSTSSTVDSTSVITGDSNSANDPQSSEHRFKDANPSMKNKKSDIIDYDNMVVAESDQDMEDIDMEEEELKQKHLEEKDLLKSPGTSTSKVKADKNQINNPAFRSPAKAGDPSFVAEFYSHSRLHHISTWGAEFKAYVSSLQAKLSEFPAREKLAKIASERLRNQSPNNVTTSFDRVIMHIDMDCFFVSVGLRNKPHLKGKPVAVTHSRGKGAKNPSDSTGSESFHSMAEIASCSYEARKYGLKNGMFMGEAKKLCPDLVPIPYDFEGYNEVSKILYDCVASLTSDIEAVSCDEMFVDITSVLEYTGATPLELASMVREDIYNKTKCIASAGLGPNILVSRLATRKAKPNDQFYVSPDDVRTFMQEQTVGNLPGVGRKLRHRFENLHIETCLDLQNFELNVLQKHFGPKTAETFYRYARGIDDRQIQSEKVRKSVSAEINYAIRFKDLEQADKFVNEVAAEVTKRLKAVGSTGKTITLKLKIRSADAPKETAKFLGHGKCDSIVKSVTLPLATDNGDVIKKESLTLLRLVNPDVTDIRGLGIQISKLEKPIGGKSKGLPSILQYTRKQEDIIQQEPSTSVTSSNLNEVVKTSRPKNIVGMLNYKKGDNKTSVNEDNNTATVDNKTSDNDDILKQTSSKSNEENFEVIDTQLKPSLPPLPCLPDILSPSPRIQKIAFQSSQGDNSSISSSPEFSITPEMVASTSAGTMSGIRKTSDYHGVFPSPSQIDQEVLMALPDDIRNEILNEQRRNKNNSHEAPKNQQIVTEMDIDNIGGAGCSHWTDPTELQITSPSKFLDLNTLKQAPSESPTKSPRGQGRGRGRARGSPSTRSNNNKSPRNGGRFKVPQGTSRLKGKAVERTGNPKKQLFVDESEIESQHTTVEPDLSFPTSIQTTEKPQKEKPSLCGASSLEDVKSLIKQWMSESPEPNEEDIIHFLTYLTELLEDKDLEQLILVLRNLIRQAGRSKNALWESAAKEIAHNMQIAVESVYGSTLKISV